MAFDPTINALKKRESESHARQGGVPSITLSAFLQSAFKLPTSPEEIAAAAKKPGAFLVPNLETVLPQPFEFDEIVWRYKVGPFYGETLEAARRAAKALQQTADSGYAGELLVRRVVYDEAVEGLKMFAENAKNLKFEASQEIPAEASWFIEPTLRTPTGGAASGCVIKLAAGEGYTEHELLLRCSHEIGHHSGYSLSKSIHGEPGLEIIKDYRTDSRIYRKFLSRWETPRPFMDMLKPLKEHYLPEIQALYEFTRSKGYSGIGYLPEVAKAYKNGTVTYKVADLLNRMAYRTLTEKTFATEIFATMCNTEVAHPGFLKFYANNLSTRAHSYFSTLEQNLGLPPSGRLNETFLTTVEEVATAWKDSPVAQMLSRTGASIKKALANPKVQGGALGALNAGALGLDIYCAYDPAQEDRWVKAIGNGTAVFTIGNIVAAGVGVVTGSGAAVLALTATSGVFANDPSLDRPWEEVRREAIALQEEMDAKYGPIMHPIAGEIMMAEGTARVLREINAGYIWNKMKQEAKQWEPDQDLVDAYIAGHADDPARDSLTPVLRAILEWVHRKKGGENPSGVDEQILQADKMRKDQAASNQDAAGAGRIGEEPPQLRPAASPAPSEEAVPVQGRQEMAKPPSDNPMVGTPLPKRWNLTLASGAILPTVRSLLPSIGKIALFAAGSQRMDKPLSG